MTPPGAVPIYVCLETWSFSLESSVLYGLAGRTGVLVSHSVLMWTTQAQRLKPSLRFLDLVVPSSRGRRGAQRGQAGAERGLVLLGRFLLI